MTTGQPESPTDADLEWCYDAVHGVSRTFSITIDRLEEPMSRHICVGYLLCRIADTIEDAGHIPPAAQTELLATYDRLLDPNADGSVSAFMDDVEPWIPEERTDDWDVVAETPRVLQTFESLEEEPREIMREPVRELVDGMAMFTDRYASEGGLRLQTIEELEEYCWYAAGTVGTLITGLVARGTSQERADEMRGNARSFALLLQLVNIAKDVESDYHDENNVYLPAEWLADEGVDQERVVHPENRESSARVVSRTAEYARSFLDDAQAYLETMPLSNGNTMEAWTVPYLLAVGTLRELSSRPEDALTETGVKISRQEVFAVMAVAGDAGRDSLADLRQTIARTPFHRAVEPAD